MLTNTAGARNLQAQKDTQTEGCIHKHRHTYTHVHMYKHIPNSYPALTPTPTPNKTISQKSILQSTPTHPHLLLSIKHASNKQFYTYLLGISIQRVKLRPQLSGNLLLRWLHGSFVLCHSSGPQWLCVRVVLQRVQTQEGCEGITNTQLFLFGSCQQAKQLLVNGAQWQNLQTELSLWSLWLKFQYELFNCTEQL